MEIKLNSLKIRNFKGIRDYTLEPNGDSINVFGDNATGKTTLYDAFLWVLFGKNSEDQATFDWKPLDDQGNEINHLETEVIAEIEVDGKVTKLSRMTEEKWTKKRGSANEVFDGHTTTYKLDDLTVKKKEYDDYLSDLIDEDLFKLLTNVSYFPEKLSWKDRRQTLIDMVGDITDDDVIAENDELEPLKELIEERPADELKQLTAQKMKQINKDIKALPDRIDEVDRSLPDISDFNKDDLLEDKEFYENRIEKLQEQIAETKNSDDVVKLKNDIADLRVHYKEMKLEYEEKQEKELEDTLNEKAALEKDIRELNTTINNLEDDAEETRRGAERKQKEVAGLEADREKLREQFYEIQQEQLPTFDEHRTTCPTCGQDLPEEQLLKVRHDYEQEVKTFNTEKGKELEQNKEKGIEITEQINKLQDEINDLKNSYDTDFEKISEYEKSKKEVQEKLEKVEAEEEKIRSNQNPFSETKKAQEITKEAEKLQSQIDSGQSNVDEDVEELNKKVVDSKAEIKELDGYLNDIDFHARQNKRKEELIAQEQNLSVEYGELEQRLHLLEEFTRTKVNLLTDTINDRFKLVKFKLFEEQINGGLNEVCEVTVNGANYSTGLNNAMKINAGIDIVGTLMDYYDKKVPLWIDNSESVNELIDIDTQLITLSVSNHKSLRVEVA
jgi:DNA repair exonuclease SbcCD ATPase subunit